MNTWFLEHGLRWARRSIIHSCDIVWHRATFGQGLVQAHALESKVGLLEAEGTETMAWQRGHTCTHVKLCRILQLTGMTDQPGAQASGRSRPLHLPSDSNAS